MSKVTVQVDATRPGDGPARGRVRCRLVTRNYGVEGHHAVPGHIIGSGEIVGVSSDVLNPDGLAVLQLERNDNILPSGSYYEVRVPATEARWKIRLVAGTPSTVELGDPTIQT